ncbi:peripheral-type benzodiazepine receptor-associated protein 1-like isoform X8 [Macrosteles quadrilineatus]|uniref:peripheral-type benzodiazepine receptor-associated protein 1-like isoform X8 n=1 Tax=Macrosteles quadrilineatus TaxID=74068 RepID=UPI0023E0B1E8|nr:peripheral-type benzodiazepine receptor-associated protein 1-like isoform X8 [Macrosteles quadrilineatus]
MREASDKRKELEREHTEALTQLREKQNEIQRKFGNTSDKTKAYESIETLQSKIRELEKKAELQNVRHEELMLEMAAIKRSQSKAERATTAAVWKKSGLHQEVQTSPDSVPSTPELNCVDRSMAMSSSGLDNYLEQQQMQQRTSAIKLRSQAAGFQQFGGIPFPFPTGNVVSLVDTSLPIDPQYLVPWRMLVGEGCGGVSASPVAVSSSGGSSSGSGGATVAYPPPPTTDIDRIMAKIDQDNRILAELDKTRSTIGGRLLPNPPLWTCTAAQLTVPGHSLPSSVVPDTLNRHALQGTLPTEPSNYVVPTMGLPILPSLPPQLPLIPQSMQPFQFLASGSQQLLPHTQQVLVPHTGRLMPQIPTIVTSQYELESRNNFLNGNLPSGVFNTLADQQQSQDKVDMLDIPGKGRCYVYIARYSYDPFSQSPNECPEAELAVNAGDYLLVWGNMDEDGFYDGELLDGRRGLVPSNFIQKLVGDDLLEFHQSVIQGLRDCDDSASTNIPQDLDYHQLNTEEYSKRVVPDMDLADALDDEEEDTHSGEGPDVFFSLLVPAPKQLTLERQLNKSVLIGWNPPDTSTSPPIDCYHVYVDGVLKVTVKATERTRALVEGVDSNRPHRISVRSVTANRRTSRDAACTMVIGKDVPLGPSQVKASRVTATSAVISWLPSNSNYQHTVCVNNVELRTVKPGVYRHTITGLAPNTVYRVTVRAKNIRAPHFDEKTNISIERYSCHIDFRTLPKGLPEPPVDIQVEPGPQDGTLLVTWQPATPTTSACNTLVTGYAVYADGKKVTDVDSPTGDHALIDINKLLSLNPKQVTVRTKSRDNQSSDSLPTPIPPNMLKGKQHSNKVEEQIELSLGKISSWFADNPLVSNVKKTNIMKFQQRPPNSKDNLTEEERRRYGSSVPPHMRHHQHHRGGQVIIETEENLSDKEVYPSNHMSIPAIAEITKDTGSEGNYSEEDYMDRRGGGAGRPHHQQQHYDRGPRGQYGARQQAPTHPRNPQRRDDRDPYYTDRRHQERGGYRGTGGGGSGGTRGGPSQHTQQPPRDKRVRWFMALFDYDPTTMSPNPDACDEELPFSEGDSIKVIGEKDADGFYWGECKGRRGYVPHNMVVEVQQGFEGGNVAREGGSRSRDRWGDIYANMPVKKMIALYDYDPQELSPNVDAEVELSFQTGNIIYVYGEMDDDGFYMGELDGVRGLVPSNFLTEAPPDFTNGAGPGRGPAGGSRGGGSRPAPSDRGHGPGARGPPPPPREGLPPRIDPRDRRKDACPVPTQVEGRQDGRMQQQQQQQQQQQETTRMASQSKYKAPPAPTLPAPDKPPPVAPPPAQEPQPGMPNLMQKLTEMTGNVTGGDNSVDHILSKGKELIFMKFGLGK